MFETNEELVEFLEQRGDLVSKRIIEAFYHIDRKDFVRESEKTDAYANHPWLIGHGQTISQPSTVAFMFELLEPKVGERILDVGSGSGWTTGLLGYIVGSEGYVVGVERIPDLVSFGRENIGKYDMPWIQIIQSGTHYGVPGELFDRMLVSASAVGFPKELFEQLKIGGVMVIPIRDSVCRIEKISETEYSLKEYPGFLFVPLFM